MDTKQPHAAPGNMNMSRHVENTWRAKNHYANLMQKQSTLTLMWNMGLA